MSGPRAVQHGRMPEPPEGGWGWVIVFILFAINVLAMGILKSFGILSVALQETFQASMEQISWIGSILSCVRLTAGPIAGIFCAKIGEKQTGILGAVMVSTGLFLSSCVDRIAFLYVTLGLLTGAILILCGLTLHLIPLGMLNRPIYLKPDMAEDSDRRECRQGKLLLLDGKTDMITTGAPRAQLPIGHHPKPARRLLSRQNGPEEAHSLRCDEKEAFEQDHRAPNDLSILRPQDLCSPLEPILLRQSHPTVLPSCKVKNRNSSQTLATVTRPADTRHKGFSRELGAQLKSISVGVKNLIDFTLLTNPLFIIYTICTFFSQLAYFIPYFHLVAKAKALGIEPFQATLLICIAGIVEIVAQLISGYVADRNFMAKYHYHKVYLLFCGAVNLLAPLAKTFPTLMVYIVFLAMFCGAYLTLLLPVLIDFIGIHRLHKGMGLYQFFVGIGCLIGPPAAGALHDFTKNYDASFQLAGSCYFVSFLVLFFVPLAERKLSKEAKKRIMEDSNDLAQASILTPPPEGPPMKEYLELETMV
ncbi:monocarboxylate transporter 5-like isoform X3 [Scyliorhinus canicula]|uniref:monocarboxylate transporter 5-like isoform X3 n=1 Tax=Scyliorhinus canicula TaxID=7830 RepID=UPI0018F55F94|nr:monocarboxylate transporter 5-like isoform X3 [Scyliorhinus canicula]